MKKHICLLILLLIITSAFGQNYLVKENTNSFHFESSFSVIDGTPGILEFKPGFTLKGKITVNLNYRQVLRDFSIPENNTYFYGGELVYLLLKQNSSKIPVSLGLGSSYEMGLRERTHEEEPRSTLLREIDINARLSRIINVSADLSIVPSVGIKYQNYDVKYPYDTRFGGTYGTHYIIYELT